MTVRALESEAKNAHCFCSAIAGLFTVVVWKVPCYCGVSSPTTIVLIDGEVLRETAHKVPGGTVPRVISALSSAIVNMQSYGCILPRYAARIVSFGLQSLENLFSISTVSMPCQRGIHGCSEMVS